MSWPTMEDLRQGAVRRAAAKAEDRSADEYTIYLQQMAGVRVAAQLSGIETWTRGHTIGALFSTSSLRAGVKMLHDMKVFDHRTYDAINKLIDEQEVTTVQMETSE